MKTTKLPFYVSFIGVGPQKTGSTWLHVVLKHHPAICLPTIVKEVQFFDLYYHKGMPEYESYFGHCQSGQVCGEITPGYFDVPDVPEKIQRHFPKAKIIFSLRHPVKRVESLFRHHLRKGRVSKNFSEAIIQMPRIVDSGRYSVHMSRWYQYFNPEQIKVVLMEDIASKPTVVLRELLDFIGVDHHYIPANLGNQINKTGMPKYPMLAKYAAQIVLKLRDYKLHHLIEMGKSLGLKKVYDGGKELPYLTMEERSQMLATYEKDIEYVEGILGRKLPAWKEMY